VPLETLNRDWRDVAISSDGVKLAAVAFDESVWLSNNGGASWDEVNVHHGTNPRWRHVASSSAGSKIVVAGCFLYVSTDAGASWRGDIDTGAHYWLGVKISNDGRKIAAVGDGSKIWRSTNSGRDHVESGPRKYWRGIAMSSNGVKRAAVEASIGQPGYIWLSSDSGASWAAVTSSVSAMGWAAIEMSADGSKVAAIESCGTVWVSTNSGTSWTAAVDGLAEAYEPLAITMSADGTRIAARGADKIYLSSNTGRSWTEDTSLEATNVGCSEINLLTQAIKLSADGTTRAAAVAHCVSGGIVKNGGIWISTSSRAAQPSDFAALASGVDDVADTVAVKVPTLVAVVFITGIALGVIVSLILKRRSADLGDEARQLLPPV